MKARKFRFKVVGGSEVSSTFAASFFNLRFEIDSQVANANLVHRLDQPQCFVKNSSLVFGLVGPTGDAAQLAVVVSRARRTHSFNDLSLNGEHHRRHAREFDRAREERARLMT